MQLGLDTIVGQPEWEFVVASVKTICAAAGVLAYIFLLAPFATVLFKSPPLRYKVQGYFVTILQVLLGSFFERAFVIDVVLSETIDPSENAVLLCNHQGLLDYMVLQHFSQKMGIDQSCFFYVWKHCVRLPSLRTLWNQWHKLSDWVVPSQNLEEKLMPFLESPYRGHGGKWIVLFPEVMPWSLSDMLQHRNECIKQACQPLDHLLYPSFPAFVQTIAFLRDLPIGAVYDVTITYSNQRDNGQAAVPTWLDSFLSNHDWRIRIEVQRVAISTLPKREKALTQWLEKRWYAKDKHLEELLVQSPAARQPDEGPGDKKA